MSERPFVSFDEINEKIEFPDVLRAFGIESQFTRRGDRLLGACPLPSHPVNKVGGPRNTAQFVIDKRRGKWLFHCFAPDCGAGGDQIVFVQRMLGCELSHVRMWYSQRFGDVISTKKPKRPPSTKEADGKVGQEPRTPAHKLDTHIVGSDAPVDKRRVKVAKLEPLKWRYDLDPNCEYLLRDRGLTPETIERFGLGLCTAKAGRRAPYLNGYIGIPIYLPQQAADENPVAFLGRFAGEKDSWTDDQPRYKLPPSFPRNQVIYGLREAWSSSRDDQPLIVVEGAFGVFWLFQEAGLPNVVATLGAEMSPEQAQLLIATGRSVVLMYDGGARQAMREAAAKLITRAYVRVELLDEDKDPTDYSGDELRRRLSFAY